MPLELVTQAASCALGELLLEEGDLSGARRYLLEAATVAESKGEKTLEIVPRALLAQVASRAKKTESPEYSFFSSIGESEDILFFSSGPELLSWCQEFVVTSKGLFSPNFCVCLLVS